MKGELGQRLDTIAAMQPEGFVTPIRAALQIGARLALARVVEVSGYDWEARVAATVKELTDSSKAATAPNPFAAVVPNPLVTAGTLTTPATPDDSPL